MSNTEIFFIAIGYIVGIVTTLIILLLYGKSKFDINYDVEKDYVNHDDWDSNNEAFLAFSISWPIFWLVMFFRYSHLLCLKLISKLDKKLKK
jgi:hypothetical protein